METFEIRTEQPEDLAGIHQVETAAFGREDEANAVDQTRAIGAMTASLVAVQAGQIIGHICFSGMRLEPAGPLAVGLAPLAVLPAWQKRGVGTALMQAGIARCRQQGFDLLFVLGHPAYYPRVGFAPAHRFNIACGYGFNGDEFMLLELHPGSLAGYSGTAHFHPAWDGV